MRTFHYGAVTISLVLISAAFTPAQKVEFSADMQVSDSTGRSQNLKLFVGDKRARFDRAPEANESEGIGSLLIDFQNQFIFLLIPQSKMYLQIEGSAGTAFYRGAWMFRPDTPKYPCNGWVSEANYRGITLRCNPAGQDTVDGRPTEKWDAANPEAGQGTLWYDPDLNFIVKVRRISKSGVESGYELHNAKKEAQSPSLFEVPRGYRKFTLNRLLDVFTGLGQW
jgi:hypothetical protein